MHQQNKNQVFNSMRKNRKPGKINATLAMAHPILEQKHSKSVMFYHCGSILADKIIQFKPHN